jgi:phenylacetate-CoA ligase
MPHPVRNLLTTARGYVLARVRYQKLFWETLQDLKEREQWGRSAMRKFQDRAVRELAAHCYETVAYYRRVWTEAGIAPRDIEGADDLARLPVLTREAVRENWQALVSEAVPPAAQITVYTSGTTGSGLRVVYNEDALILNWAFRARQRTWAGVDPRDWRITFFGSRIAPVRRTKPPFWTCNYFERQIMMSIFHLSEACLPHYLDYLQAHEGLVLEGFPSVLAIVADFMQHQGARIPMKAVFTDGEPLSREAREKIESAFCTKVFDCYGMTEWVGLIHECEEGGYHLMSDYGILEVLDESDNPVPHGAEGYLVWTGFTNRAMPLVRYRIGDKGMWDTEQECACGRPFPLVHPTITRDGDCVRSADGRLLSPRSISPLVRHKSFKACQFIQEDTRSLVVRIVPGNGHTDRDSEEVEKALRGVIGDSLSVSIELADAPVQLANGKIPLIISKVSP